MWECIIIIVVEKDQPGGPEKKIRAQNQLKNDFPIIYIMLNEKKNCLKTMLCILQNQEFYKSITKATKTLQNLTFFIIRACACATWLFVFFVSVFSFLIILLHNSFKTFYKGYINNV